MGHADIQMTANIYGHIDTARKQGMADMLSGCILRSSAAADAELNGSGAAAAAAVMRC